MIGRRDGMHAAERPVDDHVLPTQDDEFVRGSADGVGGVAGRRVRTGAGFWGPVRVLLVLAAVAFAVGYLTKAPCHGTMGYDSDVRYTRLCYSDIPYLYQLRGFADGFLPYLQTDPGGQALEYPVLTGGFMLVASWLTGMEGPEALRALRFYDWNVILLGACSLVAVVCTALTHRRRPWDAALLALAPAAALTAVVNWDLLAVALTARAPARVGPVQTGARRRAAGAGDLGEVLPAAAAGPAVAAVLAGP